MYGSVSSRRRSEEVAQPKSVALPAAPRSSASIRISLDVEHAAMPPPSSASILRGYPALRRNLFREAPEGLVSALKVSLKVKYGRKRGARPRGVRYAERRGVTLTPRVSMNSCPRRTRIGGATKWRHFTGGRSALLGSLAEQYDADYYR